jgi:hypothetical protein
VGYRCFYSCNRWVHTLNITPLLKLRVCLSEAILNSAINPPASSDIQLRTHRALVPFKLLKVTVEKRSLLNLSTKQGFDTNRRGFRTLLVGIDIR